MSGRVLFRVSVALLMLGAWTELGRCADSPPVVATVNPDAAVEPAGQYVNLYGANFSSPAQVEFGEGNYSTSVSVYSPGRIRARVPQGSGTVDIIVTNGTPARKGILENGFSYLPPPPPTITEVDPVAALPWTYITIRGQDFDQPTVQFGTSTAYVRSWTSTRIEARAPEGSGTVDLTVTNDDAQQDVARFTYLREQPPVPERVDPVAAPVNQKVRVHGQNFYSPQVWFGATKVNMYTWTSTWIDVYVPAGTGTVDVKVRNYDGQEGTVEGAFTFLPALPPVPTGVEPVAAPVNQKVRVHGQNFYSPQVWFGATKVNMYTWTSTWINVYVPAGTGTVGVKVRNYDGQEGTVEGAFTFLPALPPVPERVDPVAAPVNQVVKVHGQNFYSPQVWFGATKVNMYTWTSTWIDVYVPAGTGTVGVKVRNYDGQEGTVEGAFTFLPALPPVPERVDPVAAPVNQVVKVHGQNFYSPQVWFGATKVNMYTWTSTWINVYVPAGTGTVDVKVRNYDGQEGTVEGAFTFLPALPPVPERVDPVAAPVNQVVKVHGQNFYSPQVWFGATKVNMYTWTSTWIDVYVPAGTGTVDVKVRNYDGQEGTVEGAFTFLPALPPVPERVDPVAAPVNQVVKVHGQNFYSPQVWFGATKVNIYTWTSTWIDVYVPAGTGTVDVKVRNYDGQEGVVRDAFSFLPAPPPVPTEVDPAAAEPGARVKVVGLNFYSPQVWFGATKATIYNWSDTWIDVWVPQGTGTVDVKVRNYDGQEGVLENGFAYGTVPPPPQPVPPPAVASINPAAGPAGMGIHIYGSDFVYTPSVEFGSSNESQFVSFRTPEHLYVIMPEGSGTVDITVTNPDDQSSTLVDAFTYAPGPPPPTVTSVIPDTGSTPLGVNIYGSDFIYTPNVEFGEGNVAIEVIFRTTEHLYAAVPSGVGNVDVIVRNPDGQEGVLHNAFTYAPGAPPPTVTEVVPDTGSAPLGVNVYGSDFIYSPSVEFGEGNAATNVIFRTTTHLYAVVPEGTGTVDVIVTNPDDQEGILADAFTYAPGPPPPTVTSVVPSGGRPIVAVDIYGTDFVYTPTVEFGRGNEATSVIFRTTTHIYAVVPPGTGVVDVIVTNPDDQEAVLPNAFSYAPGPPAPTVASVVPDTGSSPLGVNIYGSDFVYTPTVEFGEGNEAINVIFRTPSHLYAVVPSGSGTVDVIVTNPDTQEGVLPGAFTYAPGAGPPTVTSVVPAVGSSPLGVNIFGSDFVYTPTVEFGEGKEAINVIFRTTTQVYAVVPEGTGTVNVIVTNPDDQQGVLANGFTYAPGPPAPTVTSVDPAQGGPVQGVTIHGSDFVYLPTVKFGDNTAQYVNFVTTQQLWVVVPDGSGTVSVTVTNPDEQEGVLEDAFTYVVNP